MSLRLRVAAVAAFYNEDSQVDPSLPAVLGHSGNLDTLALLAELTGVPLPQEPCFIGSVVGTHAGPGAVGIAYAVK